MIIKKGAEIRITCVATAIDDVNSLEIMNWLMDNMPSMRVFNPSFQELSQPKKEQE